jgi:hypothetical protein
MTGHKWLNVPYDTGLFYTRKASSLPGIFAPAEAPAYLTAPSSQANGDDRVAGEVVHEVVPSPLYVNIENSRRFRALPLLASLMALGHEGYAGTCMCSKRSMPMLMCRSRQAQHHLCASSRSVHPFASLIRPAQLLSYLFPRL